MPQRVLKVLIITCLLNLGLHACAASSHPIEPGEAQAVLIAAWQKEQHIVWEIEWAAMPLSGPLTVETWRAGAKRRFEILEATAPALIGQTLVFDGQTAWRYNRFDPAPASRSPTPWLAPVSEIFAVIDDLLNRSPAAATQKTVPGDQGPLRQISLLVAGQQRLTIRVDPETQLPVRITFSTGGPEAILKARTVEPLVDPPAGLFDPL